MSNIFKLYPTHFSMGAEKFSRGASPPCSPLVTGLHLSTIRHIEFRKSWSQIANDGHDGHLLFIEDEYTAGLRIFLPRSTAVQFISTVQRQ